MSKLHRIPIIISILFFAHISIVSGQKQQPDATALFSKDNQLKQQNIFAEIDTYVLNLKTNKKLSHAELVALITQKSRTQIEKARAIFIWIANNIDYDTSYKIVSKEEALKQRKGVCEAYSGLYKDFCELAGLEVVSISGESKQYYYKQPEDLDKGGHAWNAVKVEGDRWMLVDATWGAGYVINKTFTRRLSTYWFDPKPDIYIFSHFPKETQWQLISKPISRDVFLTLPPLYPNLVLWGFNPDALFNYFTQHKNASFPDMYSLEVVWNIKQMPVCSELKKGETYVFEFILPENEDVAIIVNNKEWHTFQKEGDKYTATFTPQQTGTAVVAVKQATGKFGGVFQYAVVK